MRGLRSRQTGEMMFGSAGWLFADLMLALVVMLVLATGIALPDEPDHPRPKPTPTPTPTPTLTPARPPRLLPTPVKRDVSVDADALLRNDKGAVDALRKRVRDMLDKPLGGRRAGIVLTFGPGSGDIARGVKIAKSFNEKVLGALGGGQFTRDTAYRSYFQGGDKVTFEIFVFES
ncbi:hypothetical protein GCM10022254_32520 [Actinomadura meridiana]|uniref:Uncharacterized protein n=1 Tax=Actinomadura meridiana TaxID=559626 RepID=A0ABP8C2T3_9ACTN